MTTQPIHTTHVHQASERVTDGPFTLEKRHLMWYSIMDPGHHIPEGQRFLATEAYLLLRWTRRIWDDSTRPHHVAAAEECAKIAARLPYRFRAGSTDVWGVLMAESAEIVNSLDFGLTESLVCQRLQAAREQVERWEQEPEGKSEGEQA